MKGRVKLVSMAYYQRLPMVLLRLSERVLPRER